jgi:hypothetical protein
MIIPGLASVTFRQLSSIEIIDLVVRGGLKAIEWGGDIHVPHGDFSTALEIGKRTRDAGLAVASYGSYFCLGKSRSEGLEFAKVLETAIALGAPIIRIWAGTRGSGEVTRNERQKLVSETFEIARAAAEENIKISMEFHSGTLADNARSVVNFINECASKNIMTHWQPSGGLGHHECKKSLETIAGNLSCIHVFAWKKLSDGAFHRLPLATHSAEWLEYFSLVPKDAFCHYALLEFVKDDSPECFLFDAVSLKNFLMKTEQYNDLF